MATLTESVYWDTPIYLIERTDPLMGGQLGVNNVQAKQLANRTQWLKSVILSAHSAVGGHELTKTDLAENSAIPESKLALDFATQALKDACTDQQATLATIREALDGVTGGTGTPLNALYHALLLSWGYGEQSYDFCLFTSEFSFIETGFSPIPLVEVVGLGDDSFDVEDASTLEVGETYLLRSRDQAVPVTIYAILTKHRVLADAGINLSYPAGSTGGTIERSNWNICSGYANVQAGQTLYTRYSDAVNNVMFGRFIICSSDPIAYTVKYKQKSTGTWGIADYDGMETLDDGNFLKFYRFPGGDEVCFAITAQGSARVEHMAITTSPESFTNNLVRTPTGTGFFQVDRFGALYDATHTKTQFQIAEDNAFSVNLQEVTLNPLAVIGTSMDAGEAVRAVATLVTGMHYWWRVRYQSSEGSWSAWSLSADFIMQEASENE